MESKNIRTIYFNSRKINIFKYLDNRSLNILRKLGIFIENRLYTSYEFDLFDEEILEYYNAPDDNEIKATKSIYDKNITLKEYKKILNIFLKISNDYENDLEDLII